MTISKVRIEYAEQLQKEYNITATYSVHTHVLTVTSACGTFVKTAILESQNEKQAVACSLVELVAEMIVNAAN